jgi:hypothetical protein
MNWNAMKSEGNWGIIENSGCTNTKHIGKQTTEQSEQRS